MKKLLLSILALTTVGVLAQNVNIPDANFKANLVGNTSINTNGDTEIQVSEALAFTGTISCVNLSISDLTGVEAFTNLTTLSCGNNNLTSLDVSANTALIELYFSNNPVTAIDLSQNIALQAISCNFTSLSSLDFSSNSDLISVDCAFNSLTFLDVTQNTGLIILICHSNYSLGSIDVSQNLALTNLQCNGNNLTVLDVSLNIALQTLWCYSNDLSILDLSQNTALTYLNCRTNSLLSLNVANGNNTNFTYFNANLNPDLSCIGVDDVSWSTTNWTSPAQIDATSSFSTNCPACIVNIPDANFKAYLLGNTTINANGNTEIECSEAVGTASLSVDNEFISDLTGIESFVNITYLNCRNNTITSLDLSSNTSLEIIRCNDNSLTGLNVSGITSLNTLYCEDNSLTSLDVSSNTNLFRLECENNLLTSLDLSANSSLTWLFCHDNSISNINFASGGDLTYFYASNNALTSLDFTTIPLIERIQCRYNSLTSIEVSTNTDVVELFCNDNAITEIDLSSSDTLKYFDGDNNQLTSLNVANGFNSYVDPNFFRVQNNPNLSCIQVDDATYSATNWTNIDATTSFSEDCVSAGVEENYTLVASMFPNPTNGLVSITSDRQINSIEVYNISGQLLLKSHNQNNMDVSKLPSGIYQVVITSDNGSISVQKLMKN